LDAVVLNNDALRAVRRGHPWVYADALRGSADPGQFVALHDRKGSAFGWGIADEGSIAIRVLPGEPRPVEAFLAERLTRADALRTRLMPPATNAYRLVNAAGDGLPGIVVDRYGGVAVLRLYSAGWAVHLDPLVKALSGLPWVEAVYRRYGVKRVDGRKGGETLFGPPVPECLVVEEHGLRFLVRPEKGQKTGLFLDQRENRRRIGALSAGRRVFNLFGYNGGFSVYAAANGASRVETVDLAGPALEDAKENFRLNGLDPKAHAFHAADVFKWEAPGKAGLVICDPPSLTHAQAADGAARQAYRRLNARVAKWVTADGLLATASCSARLDAATWESAVGEGLAEEGRWAMLMRCGAPPDHPVALAHPEGRYLKFALLSRL
jgi:23S rRNA (cytosine1962-C5)-methyltransferase